MSYNLKWFEMDGVLSRNTGEASTISSWRTFKLMQKKMVECTPCRFDARKQTRFCQGRRDCQRIIGTGGGTHVGCAQTLLVLTHHGGDVLGQTSLHGRRTWWHIMQASILVCPPLPLYIWPPSPPLSGP
jgi:hypothetical protein